MTNDPGYVFISYKSNEIIKAKEIKQFLEKEGYTCWMAPDSLHLRGTQDYGNDIFEAIRNSRCVLFILSNLALCSEWVRKEVKYALEKCHKPIIPFVIDTIPSIKYDSDELLISLSLQKQILNEDLSNDYSTLLPYIKRCINNNVDNNASNDQGTTVVKRIMTEDEFKLILNEVDDYEKRIRVLSKINYLDLGSEDRPFDVYQQDLVNSVRIEACGLIRAFCAIIEGRIDFKKKVADKILEKLYKLTYSFGQYYNQDVFSLVEPIAKTGVPWASFVLHVKYYTPDTGLSDNVQQVAFQLLSCAAKDLDNPYASILLGTCYQWGIGCDVSGSKARFWYEHALGKDVKRKKCKCPAAYAYLGRLYEYAPFEIDKSDRKAVAFYKKGVAAKDSYASLQYGYFLWKLYKKNKKYELIKKALDQFIIAYERGEKLALAEMIILIKELKKDGVKFLIDKKYDNIERLQKQAEKANLGRLKWYECIEAKDDDVKINYATDGVRLKNSDCAEILADVLTKNEDYNNELLNYCKNDDNFNSIFENLSKFIKDSVDFIENANSRYLRDLCDKLNNQITFEELKLKDNFPKTEFWQKLISSNMSVTPSELEYCVLFTPYRFSEAIKQYQLDDDTGFKRVIGIWDALRCLDYLSFDVLQIEKRYFSCLSQGWNSIGLERYSSLIGAIEKILENIPKAQLALEPFLKGAKIDFNSQYNATAVINYNEKFIQYLDALYKFFVGRLPIPIEFPWPKELFFAIYLYYLEHCYSHPKLSVALNYYRLAYLWERKPVYIRKMASLFLARNARLKDVSQNEGFIYYLASEIEKSIYQMDLDNISYFLEMNIFGISAGQSILNPNLEAIAKADSAISEIIRREKKEKNLRRKITCFEVAYAMSKIYNDSNLANDINGIQQWGVTSIYNPLKSLNWINQSLCIIIDLSKNNYQDDLDELDKLVFNNILRYMLDLDFRKMQLNKKGYGKNIIENVQSPAKNYTISKDENQILQSSEKTENQSNNNSFYEKINSIFDNNINLYKESSNDYNIQENQEIFENYANLLNEDACYDYDNCNFDDAKFKFDLALKIYNQLLSNNDNNIKHYKATIYYNLASTYQKIKDSENAKAYFYKAINIYKELIKIDFNEYASHLSLCLNDLSYVYIDCEDFTDAEKEIEEAIRIKHKLLKSLYSAEYEYDLADSLSLLGYVYERNNKIEPALKAFNKAIRLFRKLSPNNSTNNKYMIGLANALNNFASLYVDRNLNRAETIYKELIEIYENNPEIVNDSTLENLAFTYHQLGYVLSDPKIKKFEEAEQYYKKAIEIRRELGIAPQSKYNLSKSLSDLGYVYSEWKDKNKYEYAEKILNEAINIVRELIANDKEKEIEIEKSLSSPLLFLATIHIDLNKFDEADNELKEAVNIRRKLVQKDKDYPLANLAKALKKQSELHFKMGKNIDAKNEGNEALTIYLELAKENPESYKREIAELKKS